MCWRCDPVRPYDRPPFKSVLVDTWMPYSRLLPDGRIIAPDEDMWPGDHYPDLNWPGWVEVRPKPSVREVVLAMLGGADADGVVIDQAACYGVEFRAAAGGKIVVAHVETAYNTCIREFVKLPPANRLLVKCDVESHTELYRVLSAPPALWGELVAKVRLARSLRPVVMETGTRTVGFEPSAFWTTPAATEWQNRLHPDEEWVLREFAMPWLRARGFAGKAHPVARSDWFGSLSGLGHRRLRRNFWLNLSEPLPKAARDMKVPVEWPGRFKVLAELADEAGVKLD